MHAVKAIYQAATFNPNVAIQTSQPIRYDCMECPFSGNLEQGVEHVVTNQFIVRTPEKKKSK